MCATAALVAGAKALTNLSEVKHRQLKATKIQQKQIFYETGSNGGFRKWWYPTTMGFPTKNDHFGVFWGYHRFRKPPNKDHEHHKVPGVTMLDVTAFQVILPRKICILYVYMLDAKYAPWLKLCAIQAWMTSNKTI